MSRTVSTVGMQETVSKVEETLIKNGLSSIPVIDPERNDCFGIISMKDIACFHAENKNPHTIRAWEICSYKPLAVGPAASVYEVARLMVDHHVHHVIVEENGLLKGFISSLDIINFSIPEC